MHYKTTGTVPDDVAASIAVAGVKKRGKKPKLNKDGSEKQPRKPTAYNHWMQQKVPHSLSTARAVVSDERIGASIPGFSTALHSLMSTLPSTMLSRPSIKILTAVLAVRVLQLKELKEAPSHDPEQKHVDTFKQAANIWASMSKEEKETITSVFKVRW